MKTSYKVRFAALLCAVLLVVACLFMFLPRQTTEARADENTEGQYTYQSGDVYVPMVVNFDHHGNYASNSSSYYVRFRYDFNVTTGSMRFNLQDMTTSPALTKSSSPTQQPYYSVYDSNGERYKASALDPLAVYTGAAWSIDYCWEPFSGTSMQYFLNFAIFYNPNAQQSKHPVTSVRWSYYWDNDATHVYPLYATSTYQRYVTSLQYYTSASTAPFFTLLFVGLSSTAQSSSAGTPFVRTVYTAEGTKDLGDESSKAQYDEGYKNGYYDGEVAGYTDGSEEGYTSGYNAGKTDGYGSGYNAGVADSGEFSFLRLIGAVFDAPIKAFSGLLDFDVLGFNMKSFFLSLITASVIIAIIRLLL